MESFANLVRVSLPNYLKGLPIPNSVGGLFHLSLKEIISLTPLTLLFGSIAYYSYRKVSTSGAKCNSGDDKKAKVNLTIKKDCPKVVDSVDIEDLLNNDKKVVSYCRCWRSAKFPYCDGTHNKWNDETGDNVGPLCIKVKKDT